MVNHAEAAPHGQPAYDILVAGEINPDLILSGNVAPAFGQVETLVDEATLEIGSSSAIFACGAARLGLRVIFMGLCGQDLFGDFMLEAMQRRGVAVDPVRRLPGRRTGLSVILNRGVDRAILTYAGPMSELSAADIPDSLLSQARHLHVASYFLQTRLQPGLDDLFQRAHRLGLTTSLDTNWDPQESWQTVRQVLPQVDVFLPNAAEACAISGQEDVQQAAYNLARYSRLVAVKLGEQGALAVGGAQLARSASLPVQVVDTVGAGDSFDAGFITGYLRGFALEQALRLGAVCGALSTRLPGGTAAQPTWEEALAAL